MTYIYILIYTYDNNKWTHAHNTTHGPHPTPPHTRTTPHPTHPHRTPPRKHTTQRTHHNPPGNARHPASTHARTHHTPPHPALHPASTHAHNTTHAPYKKPPSTARMHAPHRTVPYARTQPDCLLFCRVYICSSADMDVHEVMIFTRISLTIYLAS